MTAAPATLVGRTAPALTAAVAVGALVALQARVNGALRLALGGALLAAAVSFAVGLTVVAAVVLARPGSWAAVARVAQVPRWHLVGGLCGATLVAVSAAAAPVVGVALLTVGLVAGQTGGGIVVDRLGIGPGGPRPASAPRVAGAALCVLAVALAASGRGARDADPVLLALVVAAGFLISVQPAVNGRLRAAVGSASVATLVNFAVGTAGLLVAVAVQAALSGLPDGDWPGLPRALLYTGGPMGAAFVAVAAVVVRRLGALRLGLAIVAGQLLGALLLDVLAPLPGTVVAPLTVLGALLTLVAVAVSGREGRR